MISQSRGNVEDHAVGAEVIEEGILHFDATARRRDRMRSKANSEPAQIASPYSLRQLLRKLAPHQPLLQGLRTIHGRAAFNRHHLP